MTHVADAIRGRLAGDLRPVRVTLSARGPGDLTGLCHQVERLSCLLIQSATRASREHVHGIALCTEAELVELGALARPPAVKFEVVTGWPAHPARMRASLMNVLAYDLRAGSREPSDEAPLRAWGTGQLYALGALVDQFIQERARALGRTCACGCGSPLPPGRRRYVSDTHAARVRQRSRRRSQQPAALTAEQILERIEKIERLASEVRAALLPGKGK